MIQIAIICDKDRFSAKLQRFGVWLGVRQDCPEYPYHAAFHDPDTGEWWDMNIRFRKLPQGSYKSKTVFFFPAPNITREYLDKHVGKHLYGVLDVLLYVPAKWLGWNLPGDHCSEVVNDFLRDNGTATPWSFYDDPPSPCELLKWCTNA